MGITGAITRPAIASAASAAIIATIREVGRERSYQTAAPSSAAQITIMLASGQEIAEAHAIAPGCGRAAIRSRSQSAPCAGVSAPWAPSTRATSVEK